MVMEGEEDEGGAGEGVSVGFDGEGGGDRSVARRERMERKRRRAVAKQTRDDEKTSSFGECGGETRLVLRGVADEALAVRERDIGRRRPVALVVRDDLDAGGRGREGGRRAGQSSGRVGGRRTKKMMSRVASRTERARYAAAARFRRDRARRIDSKATMETESGIRRGRVAPRARDRARAIARASRVILGGGIRAISAFRRKNPERARDGRRTHRSCCHTPTQEYVVPRSIPMAGPSTLALMLSSLSCVSCALRARM